MNEYHLAVNVRRPQDMLLLNVNLKFEGPFSKSLMNQFRQEIADNYGVKQDDVVVLSVFKFDPEP